MSKVIVGLLLTSLNLKRNRSNIKWDRFDKDTIPSLYERPLVNELSAVDFEVSVH